MGHLHTTYVREWMTANPITVNQKMTLPEAHMLMTERRIRRLLVVDDHKHLIGIVTRGDVRGAQPSEATTLSIYELHYLIGRITLERIMTRDPISVTSDTTIYAAARAMLQYKIAGLPVVDNGVVVGIITESDIFRMIVQKEEQAQTEEASA